MKRKHVLIKTRKKIFFDDVMKYKYTILTESTASIVSVKPTHPGSFGERDILSADVGSPEVEVSEGGILAANKEGVFQQM